MCVTYKNIILSKIHKRDTQHIDIILNTYVGSMWMYICVCGPFCLCNIFLCIHYKFSFYFLTNMIFTIFMLIMLSNGKPTLIKNISHFLLMAFIHLYNFCQQRFYFYVYLQFLFTKLLSFCIDLIEQLFYFPNKSLGTFCLWVLF